MTTVPWRALRRRRFRWSAEVLNQHDQGDVWFWVCDCWTKRGARRAARRFAREHETAD